MQSSHGIGGPNAVSPIFSEGGTTLVVTLAAAVIGAAVALALGQVWVALVRDTGFTDIAAAAVTKTVMVPVGAFGGGLLGRHRALRE